MDTVRYWLAVVLLVSLPPAVVFWYLVHPFIRFWRRLGAPWTYTIVGLSMALLGWGMFALRRPLLAWDFGTSWLAVGLAAVAFFAGLVILRQRRRHLTQKMLVGLPELEPEKHPASLLTEGIYGRIRHPRYVEAVLLSLAYALVANYPAAYGAVAFLTLGLYPVVVFEERELAERFGEEYRRYRERVPAFIPRLGR